jgi:Protein of unknown function (DUF3386)
MKNHAWVIGVTLLTATLSRAEDTKVQSRKGGDARAAALMEEAAKSRYTWGQDVMAVSGKFDWSEDGKSGSGTFRDVLHQKGGFTIAAEGTGAVPEEIREHIGSLIMHRAPPAASGQRPASAYRIVVEDDERGPLIMTVGDAMASTQRVKDGKLVEVNRTMAGKRFTIDVTRFEKSPDGREYPADFTVTWWDAASGKRLEKQTYSTQGFYVIDGQMFPRAERVVSDKGGKTTTLEIRYADVKFETGGHKAARR